MDTDTAISITLHRQLRDARRRAGLTQAALASQAGCMQSAVSMMEGGRMSALSRPTLEKIAEILGVALPGDQVPDTIPCGPPASGMAFCPNPDCPSNLPYRVGEELLFLPRGQVGGGRHCALCGEVLASECAACGAGATPAAACCVGCGTPLVPALPTSCADLRGWVAERRRQARELAAWTQPGVPAGLESRPVDSTS